MSNRTKRPSSDSIHGTKTNIAKLDSEVLGNQVNTIIGNPGFPGINQNILFRLDHKSQMAFKQVCQSWKEQVDQPIFWIKKLNLKSHPKELGNVWIDLVGRIQKGYVLEKEVTECLMKWYGKYQTISESELKGMSPTHIAAIFGYTKIAMFVASYTENINAPITYGWTPLQRAALYGSTEIFKFLAPQVGNPNAPAPNGLTPLQLATNNNHTEIVESLSQMLAN